jgi:cysteine desulfurase
VGDSIALASHKIGGPKGIGALLWRGPPPLPLVLGGQQQRGLRAGTLDAVAAAGFQAALAHVTASGPRRHARLGTLRDRLEAAVVGLADVNGGRAQRLAHVSSLSVRGWRSDEVVAALDLGGVRISSGRACSCGAAQPSPVVESMLGAERARSSIRISLGESTTAADVATAIDELLRAFRRHPCRSSGEGSSPSPDPNN